jgi:pteridine reductase
LVSPPAAEGAKDSRAARRRRSRHTDGGLRDRIVTMQTASESKVALVTGAAHRVGRAVALRLAEGGFDVAITYLSSEADARETVQMIEARSRRALAIRADLTDPAKAIAEIGRAFNERYSRLDVLVNNASIYERSGLADTSSEQMRRLFAIHVESPLLLCRIFKPFLVGSRGTVVNMVDLLAERPISEYLAYCASKGALVSLTLGLARELGPEVTVNGIAPGAVEWPPDLTAAQREGYLKRVPLKHAGTPEDVAKLVYFLATTGKYITGQIIRLDGGRSIT